MQHMLLNPVFDKEILHEEMDFTLIFETYYKRVYNYIYYRVYCHHTTEDLISRVFENVIMKVKTYSRDKAPFEVWLFAIARNIVNDYFRSQKKYKFFSLDKIQELVSRKRDPELIIIKSEARDHLSDALDSLEERERNIISLKFGATLKNKEIAKIMRMSESNIGVVLYRAIKKLRSKIESEAKL